MNIKEDLLTIINCYELENQLVHSNKLQRKIDIEYEKKIFNLLRGKYIIDLYDSYEGRIKRLFYFSRERFSQNTISLSYFRLLQKIRLRIKFKKFYSNKENRFKQSYFLFDLNLNILEIFESEEEALLYYECMEA